MKWPMMDINIDANNIHRDLLWMIFSLLRNIVDKTNY